MSRLVDDLLDVAGTENKKLRLDKSLIDVRTIVANAVDAKRQQVGGRRHMLAADLGLEPILVEADPLRITQVVSNLLDNAAKYTPDGGCIAVAVSRRSAEVPHRRD